MIIIGICGNSGSGKTTLANYLKDYLKDKAVHLNIDEVGHNVLTLESVKKELVKSFGNSILNNDKVNRKTLGDLVFNARDKMKTLTDITWKYMQIEIDEFLEKNKDKIIILDWILLPKTKYFNLCKLKILLDVPYEIRKSRAIIRDNITEKDFDTREKSSEKYIKENFDIVLKEYTQNDIERMILKI